MGVMGDVCSTRGKVEQYKMFGIKTWRKDVPWKFQAEKSERIISQQTEPVLLDSNYLIQSWYQWQAFVNMDMNLVWLKKELIFYSVISVL